MAAVQNVVGDGSQGLAVKSFVDQDLEGAGDRFLGAVASSTAGGADWAPMPTWPLEPRSLVLRGWMSGRRRQASPLLALA